MSATVLCHSASSALSCEAQEREDSDLDVLVDYSRLPDLFNFVAMKLELSELLGVKVDLVMKKGLKPRVGKQILADLVLV